MIGELGYYEGFSMIGEELGYYIGFSMTGVELGYYEGFYMISILNKRVEFLYITIYLCR